MGKEQNKDPVFESRNKGGKELPWEGQMSQEFQHRYGRIYWRKRDYNLVFITKHSIAFIRNKYF